VTVYRARNVEVTSTDRMLLQADGEVLGRAPASLSIVPLALKFLV
jgi:diacylglycerol kinase family enzyme